jgi:Zn-dependent peptidase ImmA (M78 family)
MTKPSTTRLPNPALAAEKLLGRVEYAGTATNLNKVVSLWPKLSVVEEDLDGAGYLLPIGELGGTILVNRADKEERKRFTIAHELGHWVLGLALKKATGHFSQPKSAPHAAIERWCDQFATNLLMPESMIKAVFALRDPVLVLDSLAHAASKFKVSELALFIRVWEVLRFQVAFVALSGTSGRPDAQVEKSFADEQAQKALENALREPAVINQLTSQQIIYFSLTYAEGKVKCFGRRLSLSRILLVLIWPIKTLTAI